LEEEKIKRKEKEKITYPYLTKLNYIDNLHSPEKKQHTTENKSSKSFEKSASLVGA